LFLPELQTALEYKNHHSRKNKTRQQLSREKEKKMTKEKQKIKISCDFFCSCRLPLLDLFKAFRNAFQWQKPRFVKRI